MMASNPRGKVCIGTSGWSYKHWKGTFYPTNIRQALQLNEYCKSFRTVEINNSFYRLPDQATFLKWHEDTPADFIFSVKGSRYITHMKKLKDPDEPIERLFKHASGLGEKLGPILFQLPPGWNLNIERLRQFLDILPQDNRFVFEFRNPGWYTPEVYKALRKMNVAFCIYELDGHVTPFLITADFIYVRLHGPGQKYQGSYSHAVLSQWAERITQWSKDGKDVYVYFDNDQAGYAAFNAKTLKEIGGW